MPATVPQLAARALRKLGLAIIPQSAITADAATYTAQDIATRALRERGIIVPPASRPTPSPVVGLDDLASRTQRYIGLSPVAPSDAIVGVTVATVPNMAAQALMLCGINPAGPIMGGGTGTVGSAAVATQALVKLGVIASDETPEAADQALAVNVLIEVFNDLTQSGVIGWGIESNPVYAQGALVQMVMARLGSAFGKPMGEATYESGMLQLWRLALAGPAGQTRAEAAILSVHDRVATLGYAAWGPGNVPIRAAGSYAALAAAELLPVFASLQDAAPSGSGSTSAVTPVPSAAATRSQLIASVEGGADRALDMLRRMAMSGPYGHQLAADKVTAVHDAMAALGYVSWAVTAVPAAHAEDYVVMAAVLLAPETGRDAQSRQVDQAAWDAAQGRLKRAAQVATAQDVATARVAAVYGELQASNLAGWPVSAIPEPFAEVLAQMVGASLAPSFDEKYDPAAYEMGMKRVRALAMAGPAGQELAEQKVCGLHADWDARGRVRWSMLDVPDYVEEAYVLRAAAWLAPECDHPPVPQWEMQAEMMLARVVALPSMKRQTVARYF